MRPVKTYSERFSSEASGGRNYYVIGQAIMVLPCGLLSSFSPRLISAVADWMSTIFQHMVMPRLSPDQQCQSREPR